MTGCAVWRAMACSGIEWLGRREQWGNTTTGRLFKSGFEKAVHGNNAAVAESEAWCNDLCGRSHNGELQ
jgi:hypothetical protein